MDFDNKKAIGQRINAALAESGLLQKTLAKELDVGDNVISYWLSGVRTPNTRQLTKIAELLYVSTDWLLGLSDVKLPSMEVRAICEFTNIPEKAAFYLNELPPDDSRHKLLSALLGDPRFDVLLAKCSKYIKLKGMKTDPAFETSPERDRYADILEPYGLVILTPEEQANALYGEEITTLLRDLLLSQVEGGKEHG